MLADGGVHNEADPVNAPAGHLTVSGGYLDAAGPLIQPRDLRKYLPDLRAGDVTTVLATVASIEDSRYALSALAHWLWMERESSLPFRIARSAADIETAHQAGDLAVVLHFQGGDPIEADVNLLDAYYALGIRVIQPTYNARNRLGDGCLEQANSGLSKLGRAAIARMNELRIVVDVAHVGRRTSLEVIEASSAPVIVSHGNPCGVHESLAQPHRRADQGGSRQRRRHRRVRVPWLRQRRRC